MSKNRTCMEKWLEETRQEVNQFLRDVPFYLINFRLFLSLLELKFLKKSIDQILTRHSAAHQTAIKSFLAGLLGKLERHQEFVGEL